MVSIIITIICTDTFIRSDFQYGTCRILSLIWIHIFIKCRNKIHFDG